MNKMMIISGLLYGSMALAAAEMQDGISTGQVGTAEQHMRVYEDDKKEIYYVHDAQRPYYAYAEIKDKKQEGIDVLCKTEVRDGMVLFGIFESAHMPLLRLVADGLLQEINAQTLRSRRERECHLATTFNYFAHEWIKQEAEENEEASFQAFRRKVLKIAEEEPKHTATFELIAVIAHQDHREGAVMYSGIRCTADKNRANYWGFRVIPALFRWRMDHEKGFEQLKPTVREALDSTTNITTAARHLARLTAEEYDSWCDASYKTHVYVLLDGPKMMEMAKESLLCERRAPEQDIQ